MENCNKNLKKGNAKSFNEGLTSDEMMMHVNWHRILRENNLDKNPPTYPTQRYDPI